MKNFDLGAVIAPLDVASFFSDYWERRPLLIKRGQPNYYDGLLSLSAIEQVLALPTLHRRDIRVARGTDIIPGASYLDKDGYVNAAALARLFSEGVTVILDQLQQKLPELANLCHAFEKALSLRSQTNIYFTPPHSFGFKPHYDSHDVFVLQIEGRKHWRIYDTPIELPVRGQGFDHNKLEPGPVTQEFDMEPGDMLYVPRGIMHGAVTSDQLSLHITLGTLTSSWSEVLVEAVAAAALEDVELRRNLPRNFTSPDFDPAEALPLFRDLLHRVADHADLGAILALFRDNLLVRNRPSFDQPFMQRVAGVAVSAESRVEPVANLLYGLDLGEDQVVLSYFGRSLTLPAFAAPALRTALDGTALRVGDLPGLDEDGAVALARQMVAEGLLRVV
jgi:ribosomal protein L16 Arg81 hydroxylase